MISESREIRDFGKLLESKLSLHGRVYFVVQEEHNGYNAVQIQITWEILNNMITRGDFKIDHRIYMTNNKSNTEILLNLGGDGTYPISRFPRSLLADQEVTLRE